MKRVCTNAKHADETITRIKDEKITNYGNGRSRNEILPVSDGRRREEDEISVDQGNDGPFPRNAPTADVAVVFRPPSPAQKERPLWGRRIGLWGRR